MKINYKAESTYQEYQGLKVGELVTCSVKGIFKILEITKQFRDNKEVEPIFKVIKAYTIGGTKFKGKKEFSANFWYIRSTSVRSISERITALEVQHNKDLDQINQLKKIQNENTV